MTTSPNIHRTPATRQGNPREALVNLILAWWPHEVPELREKLRPDAERAVDAFLQVHPEIQYSGLARTIIEGCVPGAPNPTTTLQLADYVSAVTPYQPSDAGVGHG